MARDRDTHFNTADDTYHYDPVPQTAYLRSSDQTDRSLATTSSTTDHADSALMLRGGKEGGSYANLTRCGIGRNRPRVLRGFATKTCMLFWLCWFCIMQGCIINGLVPAVLSTLERRFDFPESTLGRISQFYDIGYVLCCIPVSYFGGRHSKPVFLGIGILILAIGSFTFSLPHFVTDRHNYTNPATPAAEGICISNRTAEPPELQVCPAQVHVPSSYLPSWVRGNEFLFCLAHLLHGIGATPLFTLGVSYIDENVKPTLSAMYIGIFYTFAIFGPALGFLMTSGLLRYHTDYFSKFIRNVDNPYGIDEDDPNWVGAWWVSFLLSSILAFIAVFPILSFPRVLPSAVKWQRSRQMSEKRKKDAALPPLLEEEVQMTMMQQILRDIRAIPTSLSHLLFNPCFLFINLAGAVDGIVITGLSTFMAKYLERQFSLPASKANMMIGTVMVPVAGLGTLSSGYIVKRFELDVPRTLRFLIAVSLGALLLSPIFLIYCEAFGHVGIDEHYEATPTDNNTADESNWGDWARAQASAMFLTGPVTINATLIAECNSHCKCFDERYRPVCGLNSEGNKAMFFSPCFAGCQQHYEHELTEYTNCTCSRDGVVHKGLCESDCTNLYVFLALFAPLAFLTFSMGVPALSVILRCVDYSERSFALGIQWILIRCIGTIPAPPLFGWLFDTACLKRHRDKCTEVEGKCLAYDSAQLATMFVLLGILCQGVTLLMVSLAACTYRPPAEDEKVSSTASSTDGVTLTRVTNDSTNNL